MGVETTKIELDKPRNLYYPVNSMADIEEELDMGIMELFDMDAFGFRVIRALLWGGLKWEDRGLTIERAGDLMERYLNAGGSYTDLVKKVMDAMSKAGWVKKIKEEHSVIDGGEKEGNP